MGESRPGSDVDMALNTSAFVHMRNSVESLIEEGIYPPGDATTRGAGTVDGGARGGGAADRAAVPAVG